VKSRFLNDCEQTVRWQDRIDFYDFGGDIDVDPRRRVGTGDYTANGICASTARHIPDFEFHV
jgi:hypothetical protein